MLSFCEYVWLTSLVEGVPIFLIATFLPFQIPLYTTAAAPSPHGSKNVKSHLFIVTYVLCTDKIKYELGVSTVHNQHISHHKNESQGVTHLTTWFQLFQNFIKCRSVLRVQNSTQSSCFPTYSKVHSKQLLYNFIHRKKKQKCTLGSFSQHFFIRSAKYGPHSEGMVGFYKIIQHSILHFTAKFAVYLQ